MWNVVDTYRSVPFTATYKTMHETSFIRVGKQISKIICICSVPSSFVCSLVNMIKYTLFIAHLEFLFFLLSPPRPLRLVLGLWANDVCPIAASSLLWFETRMGHLISHIKFDICYHPPNQPTRKSNMYGDCTQRTHIRVGSVTCVCTTNYICWSESIFALYKSGFSM